VTPDDAVVLGEVGWAALHTGELDRAEKANRRALALTKQPKLRAQILYNAGRVAEERKDQEGARKAYAESLALRDNAEVKKRLAGVGGAPAEGALPCAAGAPEIGALCKCLLADANTPLIPEDSPKVCALEKTPSLGDPRLSVVKYGAEMLGEQAHVLVVHDGALLRPVASLGTDYEPGAFGVHNEATVTGGEARTLGARKVVVVKSQQHNHDFNMAGLELCHDDEDTETVCALGSGATPTRCFSVPVRRSEGCGPGVEVDPAEIDADLEATLAEMKKGWHTSEAKLSWSLGDDGKVVVKKESGDDALVRAGLVGAHPLGP
jgi:tetratricopeptide (TPR) repeat protein